MENGITSKNATTPLLVCGLSLIILGLVLQVVGGWRILVMAFGLTLILIVLAIQNRGKGTSKDTPTPGQ